VKTSVRDKQEEQVDYSYEAPEHGLDVGDGLLHDLGNAGVVPQLSEEETWTGNFMHWSGQDM
jgi:hypothetical protein